MEYRREIRIGEHVEETWVTGEPEEIIKVLEYVMGKQKQIVKELKFDDKAGMAELEQIAERFRKLAAEYSKQHK